MDGMRGRIVTHVLTYSYMYESNELTKPIAKTGTEFAPQKDTTEHEAKSRGHSKADE